MKIRKSLLIGCLTAFLGIGAAVGAGASSEKAPMKTEAAASFTSGSTLLFMPNTEWSTTSAYAAYFYGSSGEYWSWFENSTDFLNYYRPVTVPAGTWGNVIICRMNTGSGSDPSNNYLNWNNRWDQTVGIAAGNFDTIELKEGAWGGHSGTDQYTTSLFSSKQSWKVCYSDEKGSWTPTGEHALTYRNDSDGLQYYTTNLSFVAGQEFKIVRIETNTWYGSNKFDSEAPSAVSKKYITLGSGDANVVVAKDITMELYVKTFYMKDSVSKCSVWTQVSSTEEAKAYAKEFLNTITCSGAGSVTFAINKWNTVGAETTSMEYVYSHDLTDGAKNIMNGTSSSSDADVLAARERYDEVLGKHGYGTAEGQYHDFMGRTPAPRGVNPLMPTIIDITKNGNNAYIWIIVISAVAVASVGAFFFIKRRKEDR